MKFQAEVLDHFEGEKFIAKILGEGQQTKRIKPIANAALNVSLTRLTRIIEDALIHITPSSIGLWRGWAASRLPYQH